MSSIKKLNLSGIAVHHQDSLCDDSSLSLEAFKQLFKRYKGAGYESVQTWYQNQNNLSENISSTNED